MIKAYIYRNNNGDIYGFKISNHSVSRVCSATSILSLNTINSIEYLTKTEFECDFDEKGGFLEFSVPRIKNGEHIHDVNLLLESFVLGLNGIKEEYSKNIKIVDEEV